MKSRRYITRLLLFSFLLAVPVWAQDEVAPGPDAATPAPGQARHLPTIFGRDAIFSGIGAGEERLWKKKASPSTCSTLPICRAIRREDCSNPGRDGKNTRDDRHQFRQDQRFLLELRCVAGRDVTGLGKALALNDAFQRTLLAGATNVSVLHQYRREYIIYRIRPFLASGQKLASDLPGPS